MKSYILTISFASCFLSPLPIDCLIITSDLNDSVKNTLCIFFIDIPVENVPYSV